MNWALTKHAFDHSPDRISPRTPFSEMSAIVGDWVKAKEQIPMLHVLGKESHAFENELVRLAKHNGILPFFCVRDPEWDFGSHMLILGNENCSLQDALFPVISSISKVIVGGGKNLNYTNTPGDVWGANESAPPLVMVTTKETTIEDWDAIAAFVTRARKISGNPEVSFFGPDKFHHAAWQVLAMLTQSMNPQPGKPLRPDQE